CRTCDRVDLATVVARGALHARARACGALHPFRLVPEQALVAALLSCRLRGLPYVRARRLPAHARAPDGDPLQLDQPARGRLRLAAAGRRGQARIRMTFAAFAA